MTHVTAAAADHNSSYALMTVRPIMLWIQICAVLYPENFDRHQLLPACLNASAVGSPAVSWSAVLISIDIDIDIAS